MTNAPTLSRRDMARLALATGAIGVGLTTIARPAHAATTPSAGRVVINPRGDVTAHTYVAADASAMVTTHIIETSDRLHIIDGQFMQSFAADARAYADSLGKPIAQVILSHPHPDHFSGATQFADSPFITTDAIAASTQAWIEKRGPGLAERLGNEAPTAFRAPDGGLGQETLDLDGVRAEIMMFENAEADHQIALLLPDAGVLICQDLVYANVHFFPLGNNPGWIDAVQGLQAAEVDLVLGGHGFPAGKGVLDDTLAYLAFQAEVFDSEETAEAAIAALTTRYPNYDARGILNFIAMRYGG